MTTRRRLGWWFAAMCGLVGAIAGCGLGWGIGFLISDFLPASIDFIGALTILFVFQCVGAVAGTIAGTIVGYRMTPRIQGGDAKGD